MQPNRLYLVWRGLDFVVAAIFIYAGVIKVLDPVQFARDIDNYHIIPWSIGVRFAFYLPWLEILCGVALLFRRAYLGSLTIVTGLLSIFILASIVAKARGIDISCGCFGHLSKGFTFGWHLALDFAILIALIALLLRQPRRENLSGSFIH